jgi:hypothetical protein
MLPTLKLPEIRETAMTRFVLPATFDAVHWYIMMRVAVMALTSYMPASEAARSPVAKDIKPPPTMPGTQHATNHAQRFDVRRTP